MGEQRDVKVFISWSGDLAREVAVALRDWLPLLFDHVEPWVSDTDIAAGQRGLVQIEAELRETQFGIVVVTAENQHAPWLNFEAGALSKTVPGAEFEQRVVPLLVDLARPTDLTGPLAQFQAKVADKSGTLALLRSLAAVAGVGEGVITARFAAYWDALETTIAAAKEVAAKNGKPRQPSRDQADVLAEILLHVRRLRSQVGDLPLQDTPREKVLAVAREAATWHNVRIMNYSVLADGGLRFSVVATGLESMPPDVDGFANALRLGLENDNVEVIMNGRRAPLSEGGS
ncbi:hypothetical protein GCM10009798_23260 [Nocardioides panacihumi]|uniref:TIR domain-containing protein n=1 Tax=Nocardioides panacihumi TaxID=400774 RepID=A0ABP5CHC2_9ACTN